MEIFGGDVSRVRGGGFEGDIGEGFFVEVSEFTSSGTAEIAKIVASNSITRPPSPTSAAPTPPTKSSTDLNKEPLPDILLESSAPNTGNIPTENLHNVCYVVTAGMESLPSPLRQSLPPPSLPWSTPRLPQVSLPPQLQHH